MYASFRSLEKSLIALTLLGILLKCSLLKGGDFLLFLGLGLLSMLYFVGSYFQARAVLGDIPLTSTTSALIAIASKPTSYAALRIISGIVLSMVVVGILFKLMFWQGSGPQLVSGLIGSILLIGWAYASSKATGATYSIPKNVLRRTTLVALLGAIVWVTPSTLLFGFFHRNDQTLVQKWTQWHAHPDNPEYLAELNAYRASQLKASH
jgi:hypothetical protein